MLPQKDMVSKKTNQEILELSEKDFWQYLEDITQTPICQDKTHCDFLMKRILKTTNKHI